VFRAGRITPEAISANCGVLSRMATTYRRLDILGVRVVATSAVRDASNQQEFLERASEAAGARVEIISGQEEARLIHLGVESRWPHPAKRILVVDVGGGSAEIIHAEHGKRREAFSKPLGAVRLTEVFLRSDPPTAVELARLTQYIDEKIQPALDAIGRRPFDRLIATSATAAAIVCAANRIPRARRENADRLRATVAQVRGLYKDLAAKPLAGRRKTPGIGPRRAEIIIPGAAVFLHVLEAFQMRALYYSAAGVRDGIVADLAARGVGRELSRLDREQRRVVEQMARRYGVPLEHARQVASLAQSLFESLQPLHRLAPPFGRLLEASAYLHDIGHYVSASSHHKHSAYLVENSDMPGFTDTERRSIATLCRFHRKAMPQPRHDGFQGLPPDQKRALLSLLPLLRLADSLDRSHRQSVAAVECQIRPDDVLLRLKAATTADLDEWAAEHVAGIFRDVYGRPLTVALAKE
jgi:exopolyphosphatase/guanosine-5'-triphosphate,3'-diphosphate pyrophosphatase